MNSGVVAVLPLKRKVRGTAPTLGERAKKSRLIRVGISMNGGGEATGFELILSTPGCGGIDRAHGAVRTPVLAR